MNELHDDQAIRATLQRIVTTTPAAPNYDEALQRAALLGHRAPEWATDLYVLPEPSPGAGRRAGHRLRTIIASILGAVLVTGGGYVAYASFVGPDGYDSPTAAVDGFLGALEERNLLKASRALVPWERDRLGDLLQASLAQAERKGLLAKNDLSDARYLSLTRHGLTTAEIPLDDGFTRVEATGGSLVLHFDKALLGPKTSYDGLNRDYDLVTDWAPDPSDGGAPRRPGIVAVRDGNAWYVSLGYTLLDHARVTAGKPVPALNGPLPAAGADTPEQAAEIALRDIMGTLLTDLTRVIDPVTGAPLRRYLPELADPGPPGTYTPVWETTWEVVGGGTTRTAKLKSASLDSIVVTPERRCTSTTTDGTTIQVCPISNWLFDDGVDLVERDGRWYIDGVTAPVRWVLGMLLDYRHTSTTETTTPPDHDPGATTATTIGG